MTTKRKANSSLETPEFKRGTTTSVKDVQKLGMEIENEAKYNNFTILIDQLEKIISKLKFKKDANLESEGRKIVSILFKNFKILFGEGKLKKTKNQDEETKIVINWIITKNDRFKGILLELLESKLSYETSLQLDALDTLLNILRIEASYTKVFPTKTYQSIVKVLLNGQNGVILPDGLSNSFVLLEFIESFFVKYWDLQFYFFSNLPNILKEWKSSLAPDKLQLIYANFITIIRNKLLFDTNEEELKSKSTWISQTYLSSIYKFNLFKSQFQKSITTILSYPLTISQYKTTLLILHKRVIPFMSQPQGLMDFLTDLYNLQEQNEDSSEWEDANEELDHSMIPILTLNSLYELMKNHNLEYPDFYTKLYSLLDSNLLYTKYRSRFFRLVDLFLSSTHLSSNLVASFIKKLARLALTASASGVVMIIPFIYNLLKRHPTCMIMLHNTNIESINDPYNNLESNPMNTNAINSSLWELETLMNHYHPNIATLAKIFKEPFKKPNYNLEDFLDWSYIKLLETEQSRKYKVQTTALEFEEFNSALNVKHGSANDDEDEVSKNILLESWCM
ncbi:NOC4 [Candida pseudojiufengensis]|uniref:NOC4 n=1 Tax=Candida pseudojiufengensis TaxID=497109 RepID=UPI0022240DA9|nr:NOC4 [Candida pseudojiufengensis]KAI5966419.1 NOC4 [Candida pseudojiufengensis]